ncbi:probable phytanoyl-CoA dioxygenase [Mya arenaria]|uniref:probable phytanoyl-CoA dioxygenase n=1 Tax=Mya arenaria TaxID=6604 RepID=UPI0022E89370|nr:probable phytanoyl-CoA dioxygenase [Mya arenaria]
MMTVFIAVDKCTKENSCLQVLSGSHKCGRIEHVKIAAQQGADMDRVEEIRKHCPLEYIEMEPGDALFFHCNLLHCSSANTSGKRRWALRCAYNRADNDPIWDHHNPHYTKLEKVPNSAVLDCTNFTDMTGKKIYGENLENIPGRRKIPRDEQ